MEKNNLVNDYERVLHCLSCLPKKIIDNHERENISEFVLHGLCSQNCFNLKKAAYFIDNPDFDCIKGVAGFCQSETNLGWNEIWDEPDSFSLIAKSSPFNQKVRSFSATSSHRKKDSAEEFISSIVNEIGFNDPMYCSWNTKHYNHGILVFEKNENCNEMFHNHFLNSLSMLSFCPVF